MALRETRRRMTTGEVNKKICKLMNEESDANDSTSSSACESDEFKIATFHSLKRKTGGRRYSSSTADELHVSLNDILYAKAEKKRKKISKLKEAEKEHLAAKCNYFNMIDQELLTTCIDSEIPKVVKPVIRTRRRRNLKDPQLLAEYQAYCEATEEFVNPIPIEEFAGTVRPITATEVYEGFLEE